MKLSAACISCNIARQEEKIRACPDEEKRMAYMRRVMETILNFDPERTSPVLSGEIGAVYREMFGAPQDYSLVKHDFNRLVLSIEADIAGRIACAADPLAEALKYARAGNYIDYSAFKDVSRDTLFALIDAVREERLDPRIYDAFSKDMQAARSLIYLTDNCGEVVLDKLAIREMQRRFPNVEITAMVRGAPVYNDATLADAEEVGLTELVRVVGNGSEIAGTPLGLISAEARALLENADVILAKGQGNYETVSGSGLNVYFLFLSKCEWFCRYFHCAPNTGMFLRERDAAR